MLHLLVDSATLLCKFHQVFFDFKENMAIFATLM